MKNKAHESGAEGKLESQGWDAPGPQWFLLKQLCD